MELLLTAKSDISQYYVVVGVQRLGGQIHTLLRFNIPKVSKQRRKAILEAVMGETGADALVECFWTKGSLIHKNMKSFDAILIKDAKASRIASD